MFTNYFLKENFLFDDERSSSVSLDLRDWSLAPTKYLASGVILDFRCLAVGLWLLVPVVHVGVSIAALSFLCFGNT